jgi:hypothetical protein
MEKIDVDQYQGMMASGSAPSESMTSGRPKELEPLKYATLPIPFAGAVHLAA